MNYNAQGWNHCGIKLFPLILLILAISGCLSAPSSSFCDISSLCNSFYDNYGRWPTAKGELEEFELKKQTVKTDWDDISGFSLKRISESQAHLSYDINRWYGKDTVTGSVYRPIVKVAISPGKCQLSSDALKILSKSGYEISEGKGDRTDISVSYEDEIETVTINPPIIMSDGMIRVIRIDHKKRQYWVKSSGGIGNVCQEKGPFEF